jgi:hypothetical protein
MEGGLRWHKQRRETTSGDVQTAEKNALRDYLTHNQQKNGSQEYFLKGNYV